MYTKVTQNEKGELLAWYPVETKYEGSELDCDVLQDYSVYPHETWTFIAEYLPVWNALWAFREKEQAFQAICDRLNDNEKRFDMIEKAQSKFVWVSLDEAYKDVNPVWTKQKKETAKGKYLDRLREKAQVKPYSKFQENLEKVKQLSATMQRKFYGNQYDYLLDH